MFTDITARITENNIRCILAESMFEPTEAKIDRVAEEYRADPNRYLFGYELDGCTVGCAGVDLTDPEHPVLHHVAVDSAFRGQGIGRTMIGEIMRRFGLNQLEAETDDDAVGFYQNCGFEITSLGEKYPGCVRYLCTKQNAT